MTSRLSSQLSTYYVLLPLLLNMHYPTNGVFLIISYTDVFGSDGNSRTFRHYSTVAAYAEIITAVWHLDSTR